MKRPWDAITWWEIRRIPFNLAMLLAGFVSIYVVASTAPGTDMGSPGLTLIFYALAANLCYTLGWITELLWSWGNTERTEATRPKVFRIGLIFSVGITLLPAIISALVKVFHHFH